MSVSREKGFMEGCRDLPVITSSRSFHRGTHPAQTCLGQDLNGRPVGNSENLGPGVKCVHGVPKHLGDGLKGIETWGLTLKALHPDAPRCLGRLMVRVGKKAPQGVFVGGRRADGACCDSGGIVTGGPKSLPEVVLGRTLVALGLDLRDAVGEAKPVMADLTVVAATGSELTEG